MAFLFFLFFFFFIGTCPQLSTPHLPMSTFSITGNNRPPSFITGWRWFPHGATGSQWCQPGSAPQSRAEQKKEQREERERAKRIRQLTGFLIALKGGSDARPFTGNNPDWYKMNRGLSALQPFNVLLQSLKVANWQILYYLKKSPISYLFRIFLSKRVSRDPLLPFQP